MPLPHLRPLAKRAFRHMPRVWTRGLDAYQQRRHGGARAPARLDVMTAIGGNNLDVLQVMLLSLSESHPRDHVRFWLFHLHLGPDKLAELARFCDTLPNLELRLVHVTDNKGFMQLSELGGRPFGARFLWLVAHQHLPGDLRRVLFLDPLDILVTDDLLPFLNQPLLGRLVAACRESPYSPPLIAGPARQAHARGASNDRILRISKGIVNSGAMVINLDRARRDGLSIQTYLDVATWAQEKLDLSFGDQGLFSLAHGSDYVQAHDRYNFRFHEATRRDTALRPAVAHFAGKVAKPFHLRLTAGQEEMVLTHLKATGAEKVQLNPFQSIKAFDLAHYRLWWETCARTPVHARIAPTANEFATRVLAEQGLGDQRHAPAAQ